MAEVVSIFTAQDKGQPMVSHQLIQALAGVGLAGDRYANRRGAFSGAKARQTVRHVSLIAEEAIAAANAELDNPFAPEETRRNILTRGINLNELVGVEFSVGVVRMRGVELCDPCGRPANLAGKAYFDVAFADRGGLRAEVLSGGTINVGDAITINA